MPRFIAVIILCLIMGAFWAEAGEKERPTDHQKIDAEDLKVAAEMEILQLMDLLEDMDMLKDINYLIEDDQNETETD